MPSVAINVNLAEIGKFAKKLEKVDATRLRASIRKTVKAAGDDMLKQAKANASWSKKIPRATTLKTSFAARSAGVTMRTNPKSAPMAYFFERGSKGSGGRYIKHPVYGSNSDSSGGRDKRGRLRPDVRDRYDEKGTWRSMPTRPYFFKAGTAGKEEFQKKLREDLDGIARELGYDG